MVPEVVVPLENGPRPERHNPLASITLWRAHATSPPCRGGGPELAREFFDSGS